MAGILPFGPKAGRFLHRSWRQDALLNILEGSIRSSKTWVINAKFVQLLATGWWPGGTGLITGNSKASVKTNLLEDIFAIVGEKNYKYNQSSGELKLMGRRFRVVGAKDESSARAIKGATVGLWIADELTLYPQSFFEMAISRLSLPHSRMYGSTNPADPYHYLKTEYLDNEEMRARGDLWSEHFTLDDNPNISKERKEQFKRMFTGVFYQRNINGLWVIAEGAIYRDVLTDDVFYTDAERPIGLKSRNGHFEHWVAVDYGTMNPMVFLDIYDDGKTLWVDREYYYDSRRAMRQKTDAEYGADFIKFIAGGDPLNPDDKTPLLDQREWPGAIVDPSAASFITELRQRNVWVTQADNEVIEGIRMVSTLFNRKRLKINKRCKNTIAELNSYSWNEKVIGKEEPIKENDHACDTVRYMVKTRIPSWRLAA